MAQGNNDNSLSIGLGSDVLFQLEGTKERLKAVLIGMEPPKYIILNVPSISALQQEIGIGSDMIVRYVFLGNVFAFRATVLGVISEPFPLTFISYPKSIESLNLRSEKRVECNIPANVFVNHRRTTGVIVDISFNGVRLVCEILENMSIELDNEVFVEFPLPGVKGEHNFFGKIKNIVKDKDKASLGVQFLNLDPVLKNRLRSYLDSVLERL
jgi:hypothetical protein